MIKQSKFSTMTKIAAYWKKKKIFISRRIAMLREARHEEETTPIWFIAWLYETCALLDGWEGPATGNLEATRVAGVEVVTETPFTAECVKCWNLLLCLGVFEYEYVNTYVSFRRSSCVTSLDKSSEKNKGLNCSNRSPKIIMESLVETRYQRHKNTFLKPISSDHL